MLTEIIRALLLGVCVAVPIGPVLLLVLQKTLSRGRWCGIVTGTGSAVIDTAYAAISLYALSLVKDYIFGHEHIIMIAGGSIVLALGLLLAFRRTEQVKERPFKGKTAVSYMLQAAGCALSNPGALLFSFALMAFFGLASEDVQTPAWLILIFVFIGEMAWWHFLTFALMHFKKFSSRSVERLSHISGWVIAAFGIFLVVKGLLHFV